MTKVEAPTLEEAYTKASQLLECSISELQYEVVQHPSRGILGFMKKNDANNLGGDVGKYTFQIK
jgi:spoIIIJ-associated protein